LNFKLYMDIEIQGGERKTSLEQVLAAASLGKAFKLCYGLINWVKIETDTTLLNIILNDLQQHIWTVKSHLKTLYKGIYIYIYIYICVCMCVCVMGHAVVQLVETLRYKPEGRGFDSRW
jgi:hypothetical protein